MKKAFPRSFISVRYLVMIVLPLAVIAGVYKYSSVNFHRSFIPLDPTLVKTSPWKTYSLTCSLDFKTPVPGEERILYPLKDNGKNFLRVRIDMLNDLVIEFKKGEKYQKVNVRYPLFVGRSYTLHIIADPFHRKIFLTEKNGPVLLKKFHIGYLPPYSISDIPTVEDLEKNNILKSSYFSISDRRPLSYDFLLSLMFAAAIFLFILILNLKPLEKKSWGPFVLKWMKYFLCFELFFSLFSFWICYRSNRLDLMFLLSMLVIFSPVIWLCCRQIEKCSLEPFKQRTDRIFFHGLLALMILPVMFLSFEQFSITDHRFLNKMPSLFIKNQGINNNCGKEFEGFLSDHVGGRSLMLRIINKIKGMVNLPINNNGIWIGKDNWYFYTIKEYMNIVDFKPEKKDAVVKNIQNIAEFCKKNNIKFYFLIGPAKAQIYPQNIKFFKKTRPDKFRLVNILKEELKSSPVTIIDPTEYLRELAQDPNLPLLYYRGDHHCSDFGGYHIYQYAIKMIKKDFPDLSLYEFDKKNFVMRTARNHGTRSIMHIGDDYQSTYLESLDIDTFYKKNWPTEFTSENKNSLYKLGWYGDSFTFWLIPYFSLGSFKQTFIFPVSQFKIIGESAKSRQCDILILQVWEGSLENWADKLNFQEKE